MRRARIRATSSQETREPAPAAAVVTCWEPWRPWPWTWRWLPAAPTAMATAALNRNRNQSTVPAHGEQAVDLGGHDGAEHGGAEGAAQLHGRGLQAAGHAGQLCRGVADDDVGGADHHRAQAQAEQHEPDDGVVRAGGGAQPEQAEHGDRGHGHARHDRDARADPADQRACDGGADDEHGGHRQQVHQFATLLHRMVDDFL